MWVGRGPFTETGKAGREGRNIFGGGGQEFSFRHTRWDMSVRCSSGGVSGIWRSDLELNWLNE